MWRIYAQSNCEKSNGGEVVKLEKFADIKIVDHLRKEQIPGTYVT